ncbi:long-chain-fatty-acid--CoA ligase 6-like [Amphiura filiformis]|uniref:long-chain-fatty-acid--CoA ligase 6-like n=1 Tax=Amphiura filiformis TaxID=82378 RepID=UPI003B20EBC0
MADAISFLSNPYTVAALGTAAATSAYWVISNINMPVVQPPIDIRRQSIELPGGEHIHVSPLTGVDGKLLKYRYDDVQTIYEAFLKGRKLCGDQPCYGVCQDENTIAWKTYNEVFQIAQELGSGLIARGVEPGKGTMIGIYAQNRLQWGYAEIACTMYTLCSVPLYDTLGPDACSFIIDQAQMSTVISDTKQRIKTLLEKADESSCLKEIIAMLPSEVDDDLRSMAEQKGVSLVTFDEILEEGKSNLREPVPPKPDDLYTVCYTSGITGDPKGALITHGNLIATTAGLQAICEVPPMTFRPGVRLLSYLPLAHMYERLCQAMMTMHGGQIAFYRGDVKKILDDVRMTHPTGFPSVPRLLNRVYDKVQQGVAQANWVKRTLFNMAMNSKKKDLERGVVRRDSIWDKLVFKKFQDLMGGDVEIIFSGAAPLSGDVMTFLRCAFGCHVIEGYGQTESSVATTFTVPGDHTVGHVGAPIPCNQIKLVDIPEMDYFADKDQGEVCYKGYNIFQGYLNNPDKTKEALDEDGWLHSGDIGQWLPNGSLKIIDRKKNIFKLAQGEYLAPEKIENVYIGCSLVEQVWVHGDSLQAFAVGFVIPDRETLLPWAQKKDISATFEDLCNNETVKKGILEEMIAAGRTSGLKSFEQVKDIHVCSDLFSVENGLLTPTFKLKRPVLKKKFAAEIEALYEKNQ